MPKGGKLSIQTDNVELDEAFCSQHHHVTPGRYVMLAVSDSGHGMTEEVQTRIFEPFFTTKEQGKGTGLGLSTVYGIVQQSGGAITVHSVPGAGTQVDVYFPVTTEAVTTPVVIEKTSPGGSERILVVEDDQELGELVRNLLARFGYTVTVAENAAAAIRLLDANNDFQLLLTDIVMPGMSGLELVRQIENRGLGIKKMYMTGYSEDFIAERGKKG